MADALATIPAPSALETVDPSRINWGRERVELIKRTICPSGISDDEFSLFVAQCQRAGLDPLLGEAFCVPRRQKVKRRVRRKTANGGEVESVEEEWVERHVMQPAEAGMEARADRFPDFRGIKAGAVYEGDTIEIDNGSCTVVHKHNPLKHGALVLAWAQAFRDGRALPVAQCLLAAHSQPQSSFWQRMPATMLVKCARAAALRIAYPSAFADCYCAEEMTPPADEQPQQPQAQSRPQAQRRAAPTSSSAAPKAPPIGPRAPPPVAPASVPPPATAPDTVEGEVVLTGTTPAGSPLRVVDAAPEPAAAPQREPGADEDEPGGDNGAQPGRPPQAAAPAAPQATVPQAAAPAKPRANAPPRSVSAEIDLLLKALLSCHSEDDLREWLRAKNAATVSEAGLAKLREAYKGIAATIKGRK